MLPIHVVLKAVKIPAVVLEHLQEQCSFFRYQPLSMFRALLLKQLRRIPSDRELERELYRRQEYRQACGFKFKVPDHSTFSVFRKRLGNKFEDLFKQPLMELTDLGFIKAQTVAVDSTHLKAYCRPKKDKPQSDKDASFGHKSKKKTFFGYKLHVVCDTETELPLALKVSTGKHADVSYAVPTIKKMLKQHQANMRTFLGDGAYYSTDIHQHVIGLQARPITDYPKRKVSLPSDYKKRTSIERLFGRAKDTLNLNALKVRGLHKVLQHCYLCLTSMLYAALAAYKNNKPYLARSVMQIA